MVGDSHLLVLHRSSPSVARCRVAAGVTLVPLPLTGETPAGSWHVGGCGVDEMLATEIGGVGRLERIAGVPVYLQCAVEDPIEGTWCNGLAHGTVGGRESLLTAEQPSTTHKRLVGRSPARSGQERTRIEITENTASRTVIYYGLLGSKVAYRAVMGADGLRQGRPEKTTWPETPGPGFEVVEERESRRSPRHLRLINGDAAGVAIEGISEELSTFGPSVVEIRGANLLIFSEGLGEETLIWGAFLDVVGAAIAGRFRVSEGDFEAGYGHVDVHEGQAFVAWDQADDRGRAVRVARLVCE